MMFGYECNDILIEDGICKGVFISKGNEHLQIDAEKIVVLDDGVIAGIGTHTELLKTCQVYQEIASSQLSEEELRKGVC